MENTKNPHAIVVCCNAVILKLQQHLVDFQCSPCFVLLASNKGDRDIFALENQRCRVKEKSLITSFRFQIFKDKRLKLNNLTKVPTKN